VRTVNPYTAEMPYFDHQFSPEIFQCGETLETLTTMWRNGANQATIRLEIPPQHRGANRKKEHRS
jgi:hypothetical protein